MKERLLDFLICQECQGAFNLKVGTMENSEIKEGSIVCQKCNRNLPIRDFIPRFVETDNYVDTFSFE